MTSLVKPLTLSEAQAFLKKQLAESGLSPNQKGYRAMLVPPDKSICHQSPGFIIPYHNRAGKPTRFYRYRYVKSPTTFGKPLRYVQPSGVGPQVYWSLETPWEKVLADKDEPLFITEGEKKADCGCKNGFATLGLGGVWSFKSRTIELIEELAEIDWAQRRVYIVYDSDAISNPMVLMAERKLGEQLSARKANVYTIRLPEGSDGKKVAFDDFIVAHGHDAFQKLVDEEAEQFADNKALLAMNEEVCYIEKPSAVIRTDTRDVLLCRTFVNEVFLPRTHTIFVPMPKGGERPETVRTAKAWLGWPGRATVKGLTYAPGQSLITDKQEWNRWAGWGAEPREGDVSMFTELLDFIFKDTSSEVRKWVEQWLAYPIQHPGAKLYSAVHVWGYTQRTGKSLIGYIMAKIYGENYREIGSDDLVGNFNPWAKDKQFIQGDEIATAEEHRKTIYNRIKRWITQPVVTINEKFAPVYSLPDCTNYYFTSNNPDAFYVAEEDARLLVAEVKGDPKPKEFYDRLVAWALHGDGASAIMHHLLNLPLKGFDPSGPPPETQAKKDMKAGSRTAPEKWAEAMKEAPEEMLRHKLIKTVEEMTHPAPVYDLYTITQLVDIAQSHTPETERKYITATSIGHALRKYGFDKVTAGNGRIKNFAKEAFPYVWNIGKKKFGNVVEEIREHYDNERKNKKE